VSETIYLLEIVCCCTIILRKDVVADGVAAHALWCFMHSAIIFVG